MTTPTNQQAELPDAVKVKYLESAVLLLAAEVAAWRLRSEDEENKRLGKPRRPKGWKVGIHEAGCDTDAHPLASRAVAAAMADVAKETPKPEIQLAE